ncbi:agmatine deiminase family protein [Deinococcus peraridilitoris]|uniref:Peptidylarginine deiminase-like enzyme n=1 Tax=Deinococcus peraridilitoris (strain DSM 19664 / LMG 22246 / CIP 109416 / KR-200) TaxID=937777 RepID=L0A4I3_DEIPD|nr:agmatine deiminase family protein [Deinococcus peraridilitoris]AFZ67935.1 peptidylarginine deiminase-like enzyme [Deinococcus peraridilitoris DSM 19664]
MKHLNASPTPLELGFRMPAEWTEHAATWTSWPADDELWFGALEGVRTEFAQLVRTISQFEAVHLLVRDEESERDARARLEGVRVTLHRVPLDDVWFRDNGPLFVTRPRESGPDEVSFVNWEFNAWGGKYHYRRDTLAPEALAGYLGAAHWDQGVVMEGGSLELNGEGVALTTRSCLLSPERNPGLTKDGIAALLRDFLGIEKLLWLDEGLEGDHTDGHIDTITRFVGPHTLVTSVEEDTRDANHATMQANLERLRTFTDLQGRPFEIVELPLPRRRLEGPEGRLPPTYANFYIGNGFVVVPTYLDPNDERALDILRPLFPGREVIGLPSREIIRGGGSFHCVTQQQPIGSIWKGDDLDES